MISKFVGGMVLVAMASTPATAQDCYRSSILSPTPFMGNNEEIFRLSDGSLWQVKYEYEYLYEYYPSVVICPGRGQLIVGKKSLNVQLMSAGPSAVAPQTPLSATSKPTGKWELYEETYLEGSISGTVKKGRVFKTTSGNLYEVTGITLQLVLELQPETVVFKDGETYKLFVEGFDEPLICVKLNRSSQSASPATQQQRGAVLVPAVIESRIDGEFSGWEGETIVKLANGQIWQQTEYHYTYHYAYGPSVIVYRSGSGYKMKVDGVDKAVGVELLR